MNSFAMANFNIGILVKLNIEAKDIGTCEDVICDFAT